MNRSGSGLGMHGANRRVDYTCVATGDGNNNKVIDQIMLRFRPIAPRPATVESSGYMLPDSNIKRKRVKRKYVRVKKKINKASECNLNKILFDLNGTAAMIENCRNNEFVVADPFQKPLQKPSNWISFDLSGNKSSVNKNNNNNNLFNFEPVKKFSPDLHGVDLDTPEQRRKVVESWITVESVIGTCEDRRMLGHTDNEIWKNLELDSCPGFVSNGYDEVVWVNPAYRRMLDLDGDGGVTIVWLVVKVEKSTVVKYLPAFSCRVRIEYRLCEKKRWMMVPCDVCKMDSGGFAWLLDVEFALSLGPLLNR
ncbi:hypothetical protein Hanom_Chr14g01309511 [Helianthus anomalus]